MPIVKARTHSPAERAQREYERLRHGRVALETIREVQKRMGPPRTGGPMRRERTTLDEVYGPLPPPRPKVPGPAYLPSVVALEQLEARRAATPATPRPTVTPHAAAARTAPAAAPAEPPLETAPVRVLLGW
jgi:hypothetical protein